MDMDTLAGGTPIQNLSEEQKDELSQQKLQQDDDHSHQDKSHHQLQKTLALIKPDAMQANHKQAIIDMIISSGFSILQQKQVQFDLDRACLFYREHEHKPFYSDLTEWMASAPIYAMVLEKKNAIQDWRTLMGPTNAIKAREIDPTSIRALFGTDGSHNATHGSDCLTSAEREIDIVFSSPQESSTTDNKELDDLPTTNTSAEEHSSVPPSTLNNNENTDDLTHNNDDANTSVHLPSIVDVEHSSSAHDHLSHPASPGALTCPISDSVKPSSSGGDTIVATAETDTGSGEGTTTNDLQDSITITTINNDHDGDANETKLANSIVDETPEQNKRDSLPDTSSLPKQQVYQENPVTESITTQALDDHSTTETGPSNELTATQQDQYEVLDDHSSSPADSCTATTDLNEKNDDGNTERTAVSTVPTTDLLLVNEEKTADDHNGTASVELDTIDKTKEKASVNSEISLSDGGHHHQQHQDVELLHDNSHDLTPEQETESLAIKDVATPVISELDIKLEPKAPVITDSDIKTETAVDTNNDHQKEESTVSNEPSTTHIDDIKESTISSTDNEDNDQEKDDKKAGSDNKDIEHPMGQEHVKYEEHRDDIATDDKFDTIPLASDVEANEAAAKEHVKPVVDAVAAVVTENLADQVPEAAVSDALSELASTAAVGLVAEETADQSPKPTVSVAESEPMVSVVESEPVVSVVKSEPVVSVVESEPVNSAVELVVEETADQSPEPTASVVESESVVSVETLATAPVNDIHVSKERVDSVPAAIVPVEAESVVEPLPAAEVTSVEKEEEPISESINEKSLTVAIDDTTPIEQTAEDENEPVVAEADIVDKEVGSIGEQYSDVEELEVNDDQSSVIKAGKGQVEPSTVTSHDESVLATDESVIVHDKTAELSHDDKQNDTKTATIEEDLMTEDADVSAIDQEHPSETSNQSVSSTENEETTLDQTKSIPDSDEEQIVADQDKASTSEESSKTATKDKKVASPANKPASPTQSPTRKSPTSGLKAPSKIGTTRKVPGTTTTSGAKSNNTATTSATTRLRRPGTGATPVTVTAAASDKPPVKKGTGLKSSASPGRTPLPRVATLAKKPDAAVPPTNTKETKPATAATKKRSSVINRLTAPTTASANKRASDTTAVPGTTTKSATGNGTTTGAQRVKTASGTAAPATRRTTTTTKPVTEKPVIRRTSPSSTVDKPSTTRRASPPTSTTLHGNKTSARSSTTTSSRLSSSTAASKSPSPDHTGIKRAPVRRISPPTSTHPSTATKPSTKNAAEKKGEVKRKVMTKPSGTKPVVKKDVPKDTPSDDVHNESDVKDNEDSHTEPTNDDVDHGNDMKPDEEPSVQERQEPSAQEHQESLVQEHQEFSAQEQQESSEEQHQKPLVEENQASAPIDSQQEHSQVEAVNPEDKTTLEPTTTNSRPKTPELAQLRNKFETLQTSVTPTRSSNNKPSNAPHNIKDLISRFN